jgi:hypothetical protein
MKNLLSRNDTPISWFCECRHKHWQAHSQFLQHTSHSPTLQGKHSKLERQWIILLVVWIPLQPAILLLTEIHISNACFWEGAALPYPMHHMSNWTLLLLQPHQEPVSYLQLLHEVLPQKAPEFQCQRVSMLLGILQAHSAESKCLTPCNSLQTNFQSVKLVI